MRPLNYYRILPLILFSLLSFYSQAQVKIGGNPKENPHPSAVFELQSADKGVLFPRLTQQQMEAIKAPADALVVYNTDAKAVWIYSLEQKQWMPLLQPMYRAAATPADSSEWVYDSTTLRVFLRRGYELGDSIYYNLARRKFLFADKINVDGVNSPADVYYPGKYIFKGNASTVVNDSASLNFPSITLSNFLFSVDNDSFALANPGIAFYNGMRISTQMQPGATQKAATIRSLLLQVNHTGADTVQAVTAMASNAFVDGQGFTGSFNGIQNNLSISSTAANSIGSVTGYRSNITMAPGAGGRVLSNVYGYQGNISGFRDSANNSYINGNAYGIFLNTINAAQPRRNYAFYSNKGHNRFGDSTLITDGFTISPRAVLDINSTSAMIIPSGSTAQRPATGVTAMFRNNTDLAAPEYFDGSSWKTLGAGNNEWVFDAGTNRVNLQRGLALGDSIYYNTIRKKFVFTDKIFSNELGTAVDVFYPGKFIFKGTASSVYHDAASLNFPSITLSNHLLDIDNDSFALANPGGAFYNGMRVATRLLPSATQRSATIRSLLLQLNHGGADTVQAVTALGSNSFIEGQGFTGNFTGVQNTMAITDSARNNIGSMTGYRNLMSMSPGAGGRVLSNVYGYFGSMSGFVDNSNNTLINGSAYGVFLNNINIAGPRRNFAFYSNKGLNRLGDSTLITDQFFTTARAVLDVNSPSAMIIPSGSTAQRPVTGITAMFRNNTDLQVPEYFNGSSWQSLSTGVNEWKFDGLNKVYLNRGLPLGDSIYYQSQRKQFVFSDRATNTNSLGQDFPVENFGGKYTFKTTASKRDSTQFNGPNMNIVYEVDNTTNSTVYNALTIASVMNPKAFQKGDLLSGISNSIIHAGNDSVQQVIGLQNTTRNSGNGKSGSLIGIQNVVRIQNGVADNTGELVGIRNILSRTGTTAGRVTGNVYGLQQSFGGLANNVDGTVYGIFMSNVTGGGPRKNYAYYSNKGLNRLGDSVLITDGGSITPRAVLDVNANSAMIVPTGNSAQRPAGAAAVTGMVRYNTENGGRLESYNGSAWSGIISGGIGIDPPNIPANGGTTASFVFNGATVGATVTISPSTAPPNGIVIAWARVSAANTIEVRFQNCTGAAINPPSIGYNIRVIQ